MTTATRMCLAIADDSGDGGRPWGRVWEAGRFPTGNAREARRTPRKGARGGNIVSPTGVRRRRATATHEDGYADTRSHGTGPVVVAVYLPTTIVTVEPAGALI